MLCDRLADGWDAITPSAIRQWIDAPGSATPLRQVPGCKIEVQEDTALGALPMLEARPAYRQDGAIRTRRVRLRSQGRARIRMVAEDGDDEPG
jgi:hypothetical protein